MTGWSEATPLVGGGCKRPKQPGSDLCWPGGPHTLIPDSAEAGTWVGRCHVPASVAFKGIAGPHVVKVSKGKVYDLSEYFGLF